MKRIFFLLFLASISFFTGLKGTIYSTIADGEWKNPDTWNREFRPILTSTSDICTTPATGDTLLIRHMVTMEGTLLIRTPDVVIVDTTGALTGKNGKLWVLRQQSMGHPGPVPGWDLPGLDIKGLLDGAQLDNTGFIHIDKWGEVNIQGNLFNAGKIYLQGHCHIRSGDLIHDYGILRLQNEGYLSVDGDIVNQGNLELKSEESRVQVKGALCNRFYGEIKGAGKINGFSEVSWYSLNVGKTKQKEKVPELRIESKALEPQHAE